MIVYVESNFMIELASVQSEHESCHRLLQLAIDGRIELAIPAFSLVEPYQTLERRRRERQQLQQALENQRVQITRARLYATQSSLFSNVGDVLVSSSASDLGRMETIRAQINSVGSVIAMDSVVLARGSEIQRELEVSPEDAIVLASVIEHLTRRVPAEDCCFVTRNSRDFAQPKVQARLAAMGCKTLFTFEDALRYAIDRPR